MKSSVDTAVPASVFTFSFPDPVLVGTTAVTVVVVEPVGDVKVLLKRVWLFVAVAESKFVPVIVTPVPATAEVGEKLEIVGALTAATTNDVDDVSEPLGLVTAMAPVVAPVGTVTVRLFVVAALTVAVVPLKVTVLDAGVALNPVPWIVTVSPIGAPSGEKSMMLTCVGDERVMLRRFPTAS